MNWMCRVRMQMGTNAIGYECNWIRMQWGTNAMGTNAIRTYGRNTIRFAATDSTFDRE